MDFSKKIKNTLKGTIFGETDNILIQFLRYSFIGGFSFLIDFGLLFIFTEYFKIYYLLSAAISFSIGLIFSYSFTIKWVFSRRKLKNSWMEFFIFSAIGIVGLLFNEFCLWFFTEKIHFYYLYSKIIATILVWFWNFLSRKFVLFN